MEGKFFEPSTPHFFKIILSDAIQNGTLAIPKKFMRKHGSCLSKSKSVLLKVASGDVWEVELARGNDTVWLQGGWPNFVSQYSIEHGHLLVFGYNGNSLFQVIIFDKSASEIDYPTVSRNGENAKLGTDRHISPKKEETEDRPHEASDDDHLIRCRGKRKDPTLSLAGQPSKMTKRNQSKCVDKKGMKDGSDVPSSGDRLACRYRTSNSRRLKEDELEGREGNKEISDAHMTSPPLNSGCWTRTQRITRVERHDAMRRAVFSFQSANPYFLVSMQPTYVQPGYSLNVPGRFFTRYVPGIKSVGDVDLYLSHGRTWPAVYTLRTYKRSPIVKIKHGWKVFVEDNSLRFGDVCVFELTRIDQVSFRIVIFRANER